MPPKPRVINTKSTKSLSKAEEQTGTFPIGQNESGDAKSTLLEDQNKGSNKSSRKKQSDDWRKEAHLNSENPETNSNRLRNRLNSPYQRYIPPNKKSDGKNETVKPRSAPSGQINLASSTSTSRQRHEDEDVVYTASSRLTKKETMSDMMIDVKDENLNKNRKIEASYDEVLFAKEKLETIEMVERFIFKADSALDLDDLAIIDEKFLNSIDITGYVDEVFQ